MKVRLDWRKGAQENASFYYQLAKELARKEEGAKRAIEETKTQIVKAKGEHALAVSFKTGPKMRRKREWHESYKWFYTSGKKLVVAGRDAKQNDALVAKVMNDNDLFFHADIQGAPATILIGGRDSSDQEKKETAQFAASHSSAWKVGAAAVNVYAVEKKQLSKHAQGGYVGAGGFAIEGEREWFRNTPLGLAIGVKDAIVVCFPACHQDAQKMAVLLAPGNYEKSQVVKKITFILKCSPDELLLALPSGKFSMKNFEEIFQKRNRNSAMIREKK